MRAVLLAAALGLTACAPSAPPDVATAEPQAQPVDACGALQQQRFDEPGLPARDYYVYVPCGLKKKAAPALVVYLHGCTQTGPDAATQTRWNEFADAHGLIAVYPEQFDPNTEEFGAEQLHDHLFDGNGSRCWNFFRPEDFGRNAGEAATIAGITRRVMNEQGVDPARVHVMGVSAGGAMTGVMAATYPDLFASAAILAGTPYAGDPTGALAAQASGGHAQRMPIMVVQGTADEAVVFPVGVATVQQWLATNDAIDDGAVDGSVPRSAASREDHGYDDSALAGVGTVGDLCVGDQSGSPCPGGALGMQSYPYSVEHYLDAGGAPLLDFWIIQGLMHNYPGGDPSVEFSDPLGPDITQAAWEFFTAHPRPAAPDGPSTPKGPALTVDRAALEAALDCPQPLARADKAVLLVHGTSVTPEENWAWNWMIALPESGFVPCTVRLPDYAFVDIQVSSEYVVHAIRAMADATRTKISVVGLSQGGLQPRWAIRWWPDVRERIDDLVMIATTNHGAAFADASCAAPPCLPALWQQRWAGSNFLKALNAGDETPGEVSYTSVYSLTDPVIQPVFPTPPAAIDGAVNVAIQDLCPGRPVEHAQQAYDAVAWALGIDALTHPGAADPARVDAAACHEAVMPFVDPVVALQGGANIYFVAGERQGTYAGKTDHEPPLREYAQPDSR